MKVVEYGKAEADVMILLHGGGLSWWSCQEAAQLLAERFHVVIPVLDGHAESGVPFTSIEDNARRIIEYIDRNFSGHVLLIGGLSLGGQILVELLSQRANICDYAVIESALALPMKLTAALTAPMLSLCYPLIGKRWFAKLQFWSLGIKPGLFEDYLRDTAQIAKGDMTAFLAANARYRVKKELGACTARTLVLAGSREMPIMKRSARIIADMLPCASLEIMRGFRHGDLSINHARLYADKLMAVVAGASMEKELLYTKGVQRGC